MENYTKYLGTLFISDQLNFSAKILGSGFLADMYRRILDAMTPVGESLPAFDTTPCLPIAKEPDYLRYAFICKSVSLTVCVFYHVNLRF